MRRKAYAMYSDKLKGIAVVSMEEGSRLGRVEESLFDPATLRLAAFRVKGNSGEFIVPLEKVRNVGADAVMVENSTATQVAGPEATLLGWDDLKKRKVVDGAGTLLGMVNNMDLDTTTGQAVRLLVHKGGMLGLGGETIEIEATQIKSIGVDLITVES
jgi:sporulation protein YlmC with PRC-barrel domain